LFPREPLPCPQTSLLQVLPLGRFLCLKTLIPLSLTASGFRAFLSFTRLVRRKRNSTHFPPPEDGSRVRLTTNLLKIAFYTSPFIDHYDACQYSFITFSRPAVFPFCSFLVCTHLLSSTQGFPFSGKMVYSRRRSTLPGSEPRISFYP